MKELTYADKTVLVGDAAADTIVEYSALLAEKGHADSVVLNAIAESGELVVASFVLGSGTNLMATTTASDQRDPDNTEGIVSMRGAIDRLTTPVTVQPEDSPWLEDRNFDLPGEQ
jgi:hypothetical protein